MIRLIPFTKSQTDVGPVLKVRQVTSLKSIAATALVPALSGFTGSSAYKHTHWGFCFLSDHDTLLILQSLELCVSWARARNGGGVVGVISGSAYSWSQAIAALGKTGHTDLARDFMTELQRVGASLPVKRTTAKLLVHEEFPCLPPPR